MKTKTIILGVLVAMISTFTITNSQAQSLDQPDVKVVPAAGPNVIKLIYGYNAKEVNVKFLTTDQVFKTDRISGKDFSKGFMKKYDIQSMQDIVFWIEVTSPELSVTFKLVPSSSGRWTAQLEKSTYNYSTVALN
jgi:hypothetical protein